MILEDQLDRSVGRIGGVEKLKEFDEFAASVAILDHGMDLASDEVDARLTAPWRLYSCSRAEVVCTPGSGSRSGAVVSITPTHLKPHRCAGGGKGGLGTGVGVARGDRNTMIHGLVDKLCRWWV